MAIGGKRIKKNVSLNYEDYMGMSKADKMKAVKTLAKRANSRMDVLEKNGHTKEKGMAYQKARKWLEKKDMRGKGKGKDGSDKFRFYRGSKFESEKDLNNELLQLIDFLSNKTSTEKGRDEIYQERTEKMVKSRIENGSLERVYDSKGKDISLEFYTQNDTVKKHVNEFYEYLNNNKQELFNKYGLTSDDIMDDMLMAMAQGTTIDELDRQYQEFKDDETLGFEEVQERYGRILEYDPKRKKYKYDVKIEGDRKAAFDVIKSKLKDKGELFE